MQFEISCIVVIVVLLLVNPTFLKDFSNTLPGKLTYIILIIGATSYKTYLGMLLVVLLISLNQVTVENMSENMDDADTNTDDVEMELSDNIAEEDIVGEAIEAEERMKGFRNKQCNGSSLFKGDVTGIAPDKASEHFPGIKFHDPENPCNPCDESCGFDIPPLEGFAPITANDLLKTEENIRGVSSSLFSPGTKKESTNNEVDPAPSLSDSSPAEFN